METIEAQIIDILKNQSFIQNKIKRDSQSNLCIRMGDISLQDVLFPALTVQWIGAGADSLIPLERGNLHICVYINKETKSAGQFLVEIKNEIISLFNRRGSQFSDINNGLRINQIVKDSDDVDFDERINKHYIEIIFEVTKSLDESFLPSDAGDQSWI